MQFGVVSLLCLESGRLLVIDSMRAYIAVYSPQRALQGEMQGINAGVLFTFVRSRCTRDKGIYGFTQHALHRYRHATGTRQVQVKPYYTVYSTHVNVGCDGSYRDSLFDGSKGLWRWFVAMSLIVVNVIYYPGARFKKKDNKRSLYSKKRT